MDTLTGKALLRWFLESAENSIIASKSYGIELSLEYLEVLLRTARRIVALLEERIAERQRDIER